MKGPTRRSLTEAALPGLSGLLLAASYPPFALPGVPWLALVPLAVAVAERPPGARGGRRAFRDGAVAGAVAWLLLLHWIPVALARISGLVVAVPAFVASIVLLAALTGGVARLVHVVHHRLGAPLALALPVAWIAGEWLRAHLPGTLAFPWLGLGTALAAHPTAIQPAAWIGERGLGFLVAAVSGLLADGALRWLGARPGRAAADRGDRARHDRGWTVVGGGTRGRGKGLRGLPAPAAAWGAALAVVALHLLAGRWRLEGLDTRVVGRVAAVGLDVPASLDRAATATRAAEAVGRALATPPDEPVVLAVLPESVLPVELESGGGAAATAAGWARRLGAPVLVGALGSRPSPAGDDRPLNAVFLVEGDGEVPWRYAKRRLVPWVEHLPGTGPGARWGSFAPGRSTDPAWVAGAAWGVLICSESAFAAAAREARGRGAHVLVNPTNDAWLEGTGGAVQQPAHLVLRAVETGAGAVRAANGGVTLVLSPTGQVTARLEPGREGILTAPVRTAAPTLHQRTGDVAGWGAALVAAALLLAAWAVPDRHGPPSTG